MAKSLRSIPIALLLFLAIFAFAANTWGDQVINDDLIVQGSFLPGGGGACIGQDCADGEEFGFETLVLKEENTRIQFDDTSNSASFPNQDWWLLANDLDGTTNGENYFGISDGNDPFGIDFRIDPGDNIFHIHNDRIEVGADTSPRRISNVAAGVDVQDAATYGQFAPVQTQLNTLVQIGSNPTVVINNLGQRITTVENTVDDLQGRIIDAEIGIADNAERIDENSAAIGELQGEMGESRLELDELKEHAGGYDWTGYGALGGASASGDGSTAFGSGATAFGRDTAIGANARASADGSVVIGADSQVAAENSVAVGADASVEAGATGGVALGQNARVTNGAIGSVALGQNSVADEAQTVSVGSSGQERRITNVASGVKDTDAVNLFQLNEIESRIDTDITRLETRNADLADRLDNIGAFASAFSALVPNSRAGDTQLAVGVGHYSGANAMAAGLFHYVNDKVLLNTGISTAFDANTTAGRAGITIGW